MELFYAEFGQRLADERNARNLSQELVAGRVGMSRTSIVNIEKGRQRVPLHMLYSLADALGVEVARLLPARRQSAAGGETLPSELQAMGHDQQQWVLRQIGREDEQHRNGKDEDAS